MNEQDPGTIANTVDEVKKVLTGDHVEQSEEERAKTERPTSDDLDANAAADVPEEEQARRGDPPVSNLE